MFTLPDRRLLTPLVFTVALAALAFMAVEPASSEAGGNQGVPSEAYEKLEAEGSVDLIISVRNDDVIASAQAELRSRGRAAAAQRLFERFMPRIDEVVEALPEGAGVTVQGEFNHVGSLHITVTDEQILDLLDRLPDVIAISVPQRVEPLLDESLNLINQPAAFGAGYGGAGASVAVLDTGVDYRHPDFGSCSSPGPSCRVRFADDFTDSPGFDGDGYDDNSLDDHGHGTNVSGIVGGVAPDAEILGLDVFRRDRHNGNFAYDDDMISALDWVLETLGTYNTKAVNLSLGGGLHSSACLDYDDFALRSSFEALLAAGVLPVVASGNNGAESGVSYPGCIPEAYTVGAVWDYDGFVSGTCESQTAVDRVTCFSNSHSTMLDSLAPGGLITAAGRCLPVCQDSTMAGTSQATPHVAGAAAVLGAIDGVSVSEVESALKTTGPVITDHRNQVQKRRLDLAAAVAAVGGQPPGESIAPTAAQTQDTDKDGKIDRIRLSFAENVNDDFSGLSVAVEDRQVQGFATGAAGDDVIFVNVAEQSGSDSGAEPLVTIVANSSLGTTSTLVGPAGFTITAVDKVGPVILSAHTKAARYVEVNFSEAMRRFSIKAVDFRLTINGVELEVARVIKRDADTVDLVVKVANKWESGSSGSVQLVAMYVVKDSNGNRSKQTSAVPVTAVY